MEPLLTIQILGYNGKSHLEEAASALRDIPAEKVIIRYIDNGSTDGSVEFIRAALPKADIVQINTNMGYAGGHNIGFSLCTTPFVLVHDQDVVIEWRGIEKLLQAFEDPKVAAIQGKLYRSPINTPPIFDTAGVIQTLSLNGIDRGAQEEDRGQFEEPAALLAAQGACALLRREALLTVAHTAAASPQARSVVSPDNEIPDVFDQDFFLYKEEVDLGWRLNNAGWKVLYKPMVMGRHARTLGKRGLGGWGVYPTEIYTRLRNPRTALSLRNYCWMIAKNASLLQVVLHSPFIAARLFTFLVFSVVYPPLFSTWKEALQGIPRMLAKRL